MTTENLPPLILDDIQGLILRGYSYRYIRHFVLQISNDPASIEKIQAFCRSLVPGSGASLTVTTAKDWGKNPPAYCLNIGITSTGLLKLIDSDNYNQVAGDSGLFSAYDSSSMNPTGTPAGPVNDAPIVGDTGPSAPKHWWTHGGWQLTECPTTTTDLDILLSLYTKDPPSRESFATQLLAMVPNGAKVAFMIDSDPILDAHGKETPDIHFGYHDGISQPRIQGDPLDNPGSPDDTPIVPSYFFVISDSPEAPYSAHPLLFDGCFGAFRLLYQDVGAFKDFIGQAEDPDLLAAKMCGRWFDGTPLEVSPDSPDPSLSPLDLSNFAYITPTPNQVNPPLTPPDTGFRCPYAAHTRRANPRDDPSFFRGLPVDQTHRVRRFATAFGPPYTPETADAYRGLVGLFMGADLFNQFEFIMSQWIGMPGASSNDSTPNKGGVDPLFGPQPVPPPPPTPPSNFEFYYLQPDGVTPVEVEGLSRFIRTDGSLYVFLPSITALGQYIGTGTIPPSSD